MRGALVTSHTHFTSFPARPSSLRLSGCPRGGAPGVVGVCLSLSLSLSLTVSLCLCVAPSRSLSQRRAMRRFVEWQEGRHLAVTRADHPRRTRSRERKPRPSATQTFTGSHRHTSTRSRESRGGDLVFGSPPVNFHNRQHSGAKVIVTLATHSRDPSADPPAAESAESNCLPSVRLASGSAAAVHAKKSANLKITLPVGIPHKPPWDDTMIARISP